MFKFHLNTKEGLKMGRNIIENVLHTTSQESVLKSHTWVFFLQ